MIFYLFFYYLFSMLYCVILTFVKMHKEIPEEGTEPHESVITPLQKHQKQALLWMIQRERTPYRKCRGGMLLDDPGILLLELFSLLFSLLP